MDWSSDTLGELMLTSLEDIVVADLADTLISSSSDAELIVVALLCPLLGCGGSEGRGEFPASDWLDSRVLGLYLHE